jgi:hypothetical protein
MEVQMMNSAESVCVVRKQARGVLRALVFLLPVWLGLVFSPGSSRGAALLYQTGFDASEGYNTNFDLVGQKGWVGQGSGGNGILPGWFPGKGQRAYVGFSPPNTNDSSLFVFQQINKTIPQAQFSVTFQIEDSRNNNWDDFYWSTYNQQGQKLFTLDFDNYELKVYYILGASTNRTFSGLTFSNATLYQLGVGLDFTSNLWSATLNGAVVATNKSITTTGASLNLGDFDAGWFIFDPNAPGDNFMVFDDYRVTASIPPPSMRMLGILNGAATLRVTGLAGNSFAVEASTNLTQWASLKTNITTAGSFDFVDDKSSGLKQRSYRARWVP